MYMEMTLKFYVEKILRIKWADRTPNFFSAKKNRSKNGDEVLEPRGCTIKYMHTYFPSTVLIFLLVIPIDCPIQIDK